MTTEVAGGTPPRNMSRFKPFVKGAYIGAVAASFGGKIYYDFKNCQEIYKNLSLTDREKFLIQQDIFNHNWFNNFLESLFFPVHIIGREVGVRGLVYYSGYNRTDDTEEVPAGGDDENKDHQQEGGEEEKNDE